MDELNIGVYMAQKPDLLLKYYKEVTKSKYLHFGYWEEGEKLDMDHLLLAQERYANKLLSYVPAEVKTIIDVGCGVGGNAMKLKEKGHSVTALSPDTYQQEEFKKDHLRGIPFILAKFEHLKTDRQFDLVLMSESVQYIDMDLGFDKAREIIRDKGYLLIADYFHEEGVDDGGIMLAGKQHNKYLASAKAHGFNLIKSEDITRGVAPSFDFMADLYHTYLIPSFKMIVYALQIYIPFVYGLVRFLLRKPVKKVVEKSLIDAQTFIKYRKYMIYLFQLDKN